MILESSATFEEQEHSYYVEDSRYAAEGSEWRPSTNSSVSSAVLASTPFIEYISWKLLPNLS